MSLTPDEPPITLKEIKQSLVNLIERYNSEWMKNAFEFTSSERSPAGTEKLLPWYRNLSATNWNRPFFRTLDGKDHTYFVIDIDADLESKDKERLEQVPGRSREILLGAAIQFFLPWQKEQKELHDKEYFWKISYDGLHALQVVRKRISRSDFEPIVTGLLFSQCKEVGKKRGNQVHRCSHRCIGWHYGTAKKDKETGKREWIQTDDPASLDWVHYIKHEDYIVRLAIDLRMYRWNARMFRWTWSPCFKVAGITTHSIPIRQWDLEAILKGSNPSGLEVEEYTIPDFQFWEHVTETEIELETWETERVKIREQKQISHKWADELQLYKPEQQADLPALLVRKFNKLDNLFSPDNEKIAPCIKAHYTQVIEQIGDHHHSRYILGRFLGSLIDPKWGAYWGFTDLNLSDIANWFRFRANDEQDNHPDNQWKLRHYMGIVFEDGDPRKSKVPSCATMAASQTYGICNHEMSTRCGRAHPLSKWRKAKPIIEPEAIGVIPPKEQDKDIHFKQIDSMISNLFEKRWHSVVWKSTRAGFTTSAIVAAARTGKRILVVVPTTRIATNTFTEALNIAHQKTDKVLRGAILASNKVGCLMLVFLRHKLTKMKEHSPKWGEKRLAYDRIPFHSKPSCQGCRYNKPGSQAVVAIPQALVQINKETNEIEIKPLYQCEVIDYEEKVGDCAYLTFSNEIDNLDVVFITYRKLYALMMQETREGQRLKDAIYDNFDILILDEVSHFASESDLTLPVIKATKHFHSVVDTPRWDIFQRLRQEIDQFLDYEAMTGREGKESLSHTKSMMITLIEKFITEYEPLIKFSMTKKEWVDELGTQIWLVDEMDADGIFRHCLKPHERAALREHYRTFHVILENYAKEHNRYLEFMDRVLLLLQENGWVAVNTPTLVHKVSISFIAAPKTVEVKRFIQRFADLQRNRRVMVTDATMPEVNMSDFFEVGFKDFVVGDPRGTNKTQLLISDTRNVRVTQLMQGTPCRDDCGYYSEKGCMLHPKLRELAAADDEIISKTIKGKTIRKRARNICYRYFYELTRDITIICKQYGAHNVIVVAPNKETYFLLLQDRRFGRLPGEVEMTYYRSDKTIGVRCERRVMICVCSPLPPHGSHLWLAYYYQRDGLMLKHKDGRDITLMELGAILRKNAIKQAFWQTIGRAKSPDCTERSVVYCWGISAVERSEKKTITSLQDLMQYNEEYMDKVKPHVFLPLGVGHWSDHHHAVGRWWRERGEIIPPGVVRVAEILDKKLPTDWIMAGQVAKATGIPSKELLEPFTDVPETVLDYLGLETKSYWRGRQHHTKFRSVTPRQ